MDVLSPIFAVFPLALGLLGVVVKHFADEKVYFEKVYEYDLNRANEELPEEALSPIEALMTEVVEYEVQKLKTDIEERDDSPIAKILDEYRATDISLIEIAEKNGISSFSCVDKPADIPTVVRPRIAEPIDALDRLHQIADRQPAVQRRRFLSILAAISIGILSTVGFAFLSLSTGPQVSPLVSSIGFLLVIAPLLPLVSSVYYEYKHRVLEDEFNKIVRENNIRTGNETLSKEAQSDSSSASRETESESESQKRDPQRARGQ
jgi:hypothetical protein